MQKRYRIINTILICLTVISPMMAFSLSCKIGEVETFGIGFVARYSWIFWLFTFLPILLFAFGFVLKKQGKSCKPNFVLGLLFLGILVVFGSYHLIFQEFDYDPAYVDSIDEKLAVDLPNQMKVVTEEHLEYNITYAKVSDEKKFISDLEISGYWKKELGSKIKGLLPDAYSQELVSACEYFLLYNVTTGQYNIFPPDGSYEIIFIAYDVEFQKLIIVDQYTVVVD